MVKIEEHPHWLARELGEDYGIDIEVELTEIGVRGEILKIQIKSTNGAEHSKNRVKFVIEKRYVDYAASCRYPVVLVLVDVGRKQAWYLWLQDWLLKMRTAGEFSNDQESWTHWVSEADTIDNGLNRDLKSIAAWRGETQLTLSIMDALRAAAATYNRPVVEALGEMIVRYSPSMSGPSFDALVDQAIDLGSRLWATDEGNAIAQTMFGLARELGDRLSLGTIHRLIIRGESYSRVGLSTLGILYDEYFDHMVSLGLPEHFRPIEPRVSYYCAYRETFPETNSSDPFSDPGGFEFAGLRYVQPDMYWDKYANRGPSALLDYVVPSSG